jgi:hypothetical protein
LHFFNSAITPLSLNYSFSLIRLSSQLLWLIVFFNCFYFYYLFHPQTNSKIPTMVVDMPLFFNPELTDLDYELQQLLNPNPQPSCGAPAVPPVSMSDYADYPFYFASSSASGSSSASASSSAAAASSSYMNSSMYSDMPLPSPLFAHDGDHVFAQMQDDLFPSSLTYGFAPQATGNSPPLFGSSAASSSSASSSSSSSEPDARRFSEVLNLHINQEFAAQQLEHGLQGSIIGTLQESNRLLLPRNSLPFADVPSAVSAAAASAVPATSSAVSAVAAAKALSTSNASLPTPLKNYSAASAPSSTRDHVNDNDDVDMDECDKDNARISEDGVSSGGKPQPYTLSAAAQAALSREGLTICPPANMPTDHGWSLVDEHSLNVSDFGLSVESIEMHTAKRTTPWCATWKDFLDERLRTDSHPRVYKDDVPILTSCSTGTTYWTKFAVRDANRNVVQPGSEWLATFVVLHADTNEIVREASSKGAEAPVIRNEWVDANGEVRVRDGSSVTFPVVADEHGVLGGTFAGLKIKVHSSDTKFRAHMNPDGTQGHTGVHMHAQFRLGIVFRTANGEKQFCIASPRVWFNARNKVSADDTTTPGKPRRGRKRQEMLAAQAAAQAAASGQSSSATDMDDDAEMENAPNATVPVASKKARLTY